MADNDSKRPKLTTEQKAETRTAMDAYKQGHPKATLKDMLVGLDLPFKDRLTEGVLRGLSARRPAGSAPAGRAGNGRRPATAEVRGSRGGARGAARGAGRGRRGRTLEKVMANLNALRKRRDDLDGQIADLEADVRDRMHQHLGQEHTTRIFGGPGSGDAAGRLIAFVDEAPV